MPESEQRADEQTPPCPKCGSTMTSYRRTDTDASASASGSGSGSGSGSATQDPRGELRCASCDPA